MGSLIKDVATGQVVDPLPVEAPPTGIRELQSWAAAKLRPRQMEPVHLEACLVCRGPLRRPKRRNTRPTHDPAVGYCSRTCRRRRHNRRRG